MYNKKFKVLALITGLIFIFGLTAPAPAHAGLFDSITGTVKKAYDAAKSTVNTVTNTAKTIVGTAIDTGKEIIENVKDVAKNTAKTIYETAKTAVKSVVTAVTGVGKKTAETVKAGADAVKDGAGKTAELAKDLGEDVAKEINDAIDNVKDFINGKKKDFNEFKKMLVEFKEQGVDILEQAAKDGEEKLVNPVIARIQEEAKKVQEGAKKIATDFSEAVKTVSEGAAKGFDFAKDKLSPLIEQGKNSYEIASIAGEYKSPDGSTELASSFSMGGVSWDTKNDIKGRAEGDISSHELLGSVDAHLGPRFKAEGSAEFFDGALSMTGSTDTVAGAWARGDGNLKFMKDGALLDAQASVNAGVGVKSVNEGEIVTQVGGGLGTRTSGSLEGMAGAEASAEGTAYLGKNGIELSGKAEARCGAWVDGSVSHAVQYKGNDLVGVGLGGGVGAGLGVGVEGGFSFQANKIGFQDVGFTLGPIEVNGTFYVNPVGMAEMAIDKGKEAIEKGRELVDKGKEFLGKVGNKLTFWD